MQEGVADKPESTAGTEEKPETKDATEPAADQPESGQDSAAVKSKDTAQDLIDMGWIDPEWKRMDSYYEVWLDPKNRQVILGGRICFREGYLEVFACPRNTKEHESIISVHSSARQAHACLLALGVNPGAPASFMEEYKPASGPVIDVEVEWREGEQKIRRKGQELVLEAATKQPMTAQWVFGGSRVFKDEVSGQEFYEGDGGEFICLSNFATATLDIPVASSESNNQLMFIANTEKIPQLGQRVLLILKPSANAAGPEPAANPGKAGETPAAGTSPAGAPAERPAAEKTGAANESGGSEPAAGSAEPDKKQDGSSEDNANGPSGEE